MKTIYVDDEPWMIKRFEMEIEKISGVNYLTSFNSPLEALEYVKGHDVNCAFLDIDMPEMNGLELAERFRIIRPDMVIIFISAYEQYMVDAFKSLSADYYLLKPYSFEELSSAIERARMLAVRQKKRIYIETFGNFNVYIDGQFLNFNSKVAKEIMALLVDKRGTALTNKDAFYTMFEDLPYTHENMARIRKGIVRLREILNEAGIGEILISSRGDHRLDTSMFDCDYYEFLDKNEEAIHRYHGEYMLEYSWGEETNATLTRLYYEYGQGNRK